MKVLLLGFGKIAYMPYMNFYLDTLQNMNDVEFELIYWDRDGKPDAHVPERISKAYKFEAHLEEQLPFKNKLKYFAQYRKFALRILKKTKYDRIIVLHTTPGLTLLDYLLLHYKGRFILDFRDISYEYVKIYRYMVSLLSRGSAYTYVSSDAYREYLPSKEQIITIHNFQQELLNYRGLRNQESRSTAVIRISYWGLVRQVEVNKCVIDAFGADNRFELHYYGRMQQDGRDMEQYAVKKGYANIFFHGQYMPEDRYKFALQTDIIHNIYDTGYTTGNAMGNKYYDGIFFEVPQICTEGSFMGERIKAECVGINIRLHDTGIADKVYDYYKRIDWIRFSEACKLATEKVINEQGEAKTALLRFIHA